MVPCSRMGAVRPRAGAVGRFRGSDRSRAAIGKVNSDRQHDGGRRAREIGRGEDEAGSVVSLGALPDRAPVGHGSRGLLARTARPGTTSPTITRARASTAGAKMACWASATSRACSASRWPCGTAPIRSSRSGCSASPDDEGNHGEDVKECYYFLDNTPTHSYMAALYKYPQRAFPYAELVEENRRRGRSRPSMSCWTRGSSPTTATSTCWSSTPRPRPTTS